MMRGRYIPKKPVSMFHRGVQDPHEMALSIMSEEDNEDIKRNNIIASMTNGLPTNNAIINAGNVGNNQSSSTTTINTSAVSNVGWDPLNITLDSARMKSSAVTSFTGNGWSFDLPVIRGVTRINNIVRITLNSFWLPNVPVDETLHPNYYYDQKVGVQIIELASSVNTYQTVTGPGVHWDCDLDVPNAGGIKCTPVNRSISFTTPVTSLDSISFRFMRPARNISGTTLEDIPIPKTLVIVAPIPGTNPARFIVQGDSVDNLYPAALALGKQVAVELSFTNDPSLSNAYQSVSPTIRSAIEYPAGWWATNISAIDNGFDIIGLDLSLLPPPPAIPGLWTFNCIIMQNRFTMNLTVMGINSNNANKFTGTI